MTREMNEIVAVDDNDVLFSLLREMFTEHGYTVRRPDRRAGIRESAGAGPYR